MKKITESKYLSYARTGEHYNLFQAVMLCIPQATAEDEEIF